MKKIILDTNAYALYLHGDEAVLDAIVRADVVYVSVFVLGELYSAFRGASKEVKNKDLLERFLQKPTVEILPATQETSEIFGELSSGLQKTGANLATHDLWIAAQAVETGSVLITLDKSFKAASPASWWR